MASDLRAPWPWYGSKRGASALINGLLGEDINNMVVPFAGSLGEVLARQRPAPVETVNDLDGFVVNAWRAIKYDPEGLAELLDYPVHEVTLHAVHDELVRGRTLKGPRRKRALKSGRRRHMPLPEYLRTSERAYDLQLAAWWIWGASCWLGSGWCREPSRKASPTWRARPHLSHKGQGVTTARQMPMVSGSYTGHPALGNGIHAGTHRENLVAWMLALADRLRWTRIICGDWTRAVTAAVTTSHGLTGIVLDPPYCHSLRNSRLYREDDPALSAAVRAWCIEHGGDPLLRIVLCGKHDEHDELLEHGWTKHQWRDDGEVVWASPGCILGGFASAQQGFDWGDA